MTDYRKYVIDYVLRCFEDMGASSEQLLNEALRLGSDDIYLHEWAKTTGFYDQELAAFDQERNA